MAEAILREAFTAEAREAEVRSAGLGALIGYPADPHAQTLMQRRGLDISTHRAIQVNRELLHWADLILVMEEAHRVQVRAQEPSVAGKTLLLGHWIGTEIPDPYQSSQAAFEHVEILIDRAVSSWMKRL